MIKKLFCAIVIMGIGLFRLPALADLVQDQAVSLVQLLETTQKNTSTGEQLSYRQKRYNILGAAKNISSKKTLILAVKEVIRQKVDILQSQVSWVAERDEFLTKINDIRKNYELSALQYNEQLSIAAQSYAERMNKENFFSHTDPQGSWLARRIAKTSYTYTLIGENLEKWYSSIDTVIVWWMDSPTHRANLLFSWYVDMWFGHSGSYRVHLFGHPDD